MKKTLLAVAGLAGLALSTQAVAQSYPPTGSDTNQMQQSQGMTGQSSLDESSVRQIQQSLQRLGHDPGPIDGVWGPQTQRAVISFQQSQDMQVTGGVDVATLQALGLENLAAVPSDGGVGPAGAAGSSSPDSATQGIDRFDSGTGNQGASTTSGGRETTRSLGGSLGGGGAGSGAGAGSGGDGGSGGGGSGGGSGGGG